MKAGGTLIVFYHKDRTEWNPDEKKTARSSAPYPIILDDKRVTDETAPITFIQPRHPLLKSPNRITPADFSNWIQERGLYYPKQWDPHIQKFFSTNDPGEPPLIGGLLVAPIRQRELHLHEYGLVSRVARRGAGRLSHVCER